MKTTKKPLYAPLQRGDLVTEAQAAEILCVTRDTLRAWRTQTHRRGDAPAYIKTTRDRAGYKASGNILYHRADLAAWAERNRYAPARKP